MTDILVRRSFSDRDRVAAVEHQRKIGKPEAGYISDLADLKKTIVLCDGCRSKFDERRYRYRTLPNMTYVFGRCDACRNNGIAVCLVHEETALLFDSIRQREERLYRRNKLTGG